MKGLVALLFVLVLGAAPVGADERGAEPREPVVRIDGNRFYVHRVQPGETLYTLAERYDVATVAILHYNPLLAGGLKAGQAIRIPVTEPVRQTLSARRALRLFDSHTVAAGETAYAIACRYALPLATLLRDNPELDPAHLAVGQELRIRKSDRGEADSPTTLAELAAYRDALNSVSPDATYHLVEPKETVYSLSRRYRITPEELLAANDLREGLRAGSLVRIPVAPSYSAQAGEPVATTPAEPEVLHPGRRPFAPMGIDDDGGRALRIALLLPLGADTTLAPNFLDFYRGFLSGLEHECGTVPGITVDLYDTERSTERMSEIVDTWGDYRFDAIVGPVYEELLPAVLDHAARHRTPVFSPLATLSTRHSLLVQLAPDPSAKFAGLAPLLQGDCHLVLVYTSSVDREMEQAVRTLLGRREFTFFRFEEEGLGELLREDKENVFVLLSDRETEVDNFLAALASVYTNLLSRGLLHAPQVRVVGSPKWARMTGVDRNLYFKLGVVYPSSYRAGRESTAVQGFDSLFVHRFAALPSLYAYRGYDASRLVARMLVSHEGIEALRYGEPAPLETPYRFPPAEGFVNTCWPLVRYHPDYTITVE